MAQSSKTKNKNSKNKTSNREFGWFESGIDVRKSLRLKLLKLFGVGKKKNGLRSPLGWFAGRSAEQEIALANKWTKQVFAAEKKNRSDIHKLSRTVTGTMGTIEKVDLPGQAVLALAASHCLRAFAGNCEYENWNQLVKDLLELARKTEVDVEADAAVYQMMAIELPLVIAFQIPEIEDYRGLADRTCRKLELTITDMLDHDGWPLDCYLESFGMLVASWSRSNMMLGKLGCEIKPDVAAQLEWLIRQTLRLLRPDGTLMFSSDDSPRICDELVHSLANLSSDPMDKKLLQARFGEKLTAKKKRKLPSASNISEWAGAAVLQVGWGRKPNKVAVDFSKKKLRQEVCSKKNLFRGDALPEITSNGKRLAAEGDFEVVSDLSDSDVEYIELEMELSDGFTLNRQYLLSREESFLMIADSVVSEERSELVYRCQHSLAPGITSFGETETRELYLGSPGIEALVLPLALPEWKVAKSKDSLKVVGDAICLEQHGNGLGLYAPLFIDLDPKRSRKKRTWRQLTLAEERKTVSADLGCAFRVQLDNKQWFFYRAIAETGNRTFMGENFNGEFVFSRFERSGSVTELIRIDD